MNKHTSSSTVLLLTALLITACAAKQPPQHGLSNTDSLQSLNKAEVVNTDMAAAWTNFSQWKSYFYEQALSKGYEAELVAAFLQEIHYQDSVVSLDRSQPEFSKMIWTYLDTAVAAERVANGRKKYQQSQALLERLEAQYGVPGQYLVAIWGLESAYGGYMGDKHLPSSLATLAYDGRRREFAHAQLFAMLDLLAHGDVSLAQLRGSWAGGMGHTQFIPTTYLQYGVDGNGDGMRSPWNSDDALASTANYLSQSGWQSGLSWGQEVNLPAQFDYRYVGQTLDTVNWQQMGIQALSAWPDRATKAKLWLPGGHQGPAFLLYNNHEVIKVYNHSSSYALAVGLLADAIIGKQPIQQPWPREALPLSKTDIERLQMALTQLGYDSGGVDGILGSKTRQAFQQWQLAHGQIGDGFVSKQSSAPLIP